MVALHLLKWVAFQEDVAGREIELRYFRDVDGREVDFVVVEDQRPSLFVECKWGDGAIGKGLKYLKTRFPDSRACQITATGRKDYLTPDGIRAQPAGDFLRTLI